MAETPKAPTVDRPIVEVTVAAPVDEAWRMLRDPEQVGRWFGWDYEQLKDEIQQIFIDGTEADEARHILRFKSSEDRYEVGSERGRTVVRVVRPAPAADTDWDAVFDDVIQGWIAFTQQLRFTMERHPSAERRALYLSGSPRVAGGALGAAALGVLPTAAAGATCAVALGAGAPAPGVVWHRSRHQVSVALDGWNRALILVMDRPANAKWPNGGCQVILSTYGMPAEGYDAAAAQCIRWWNDHFGPSVRVKANK